MGMNEFHQELAGCLDAVADISSRYGLTTKATLVLRDPSSKEGSVVMTCESNAGLVEVADTVLDYLRRKPSSEGTVIDAMLGNAKR